MAAQSVVLTRRTQAVSKTELLKEVVYGVITELPHTSEYKKNFFDLQKTKICLFTQNILAFTCIKIFVYT